MEEVIVHTLPIKRAICIATDDSQSGGRCHRMRNPAIGQLLLPVMGLNIDLLTIDHPEVTSDKRRSMSNIFAILAKALINANGYLEFYFTHSIYIMLAN